MISAEILRTPDLLPSEKLVFTRLMHFLRSFPDTAHNPTGSQLVLSCIEERPAFQIGRRLRATSLHAQGAVLLR